MEFYYVEHVIRTFKLPYTVSTGDVWTIYMLLTDGLTYGWGGKFNDALQKYPIVSFPIPTQCPVQFFSLSFFPRMDLTVENPT